MNVEVDCEVWKKPKLKELKKCLIAMNVSNIEMNKKEY